MIGIYVSVFSQMTEAIEFYNDIEINTIHLKLKLRGFLFISLNAVYAFFLNINIGSNWRHCLFLCKVFFLIEC